MDIPVNGIKLNNNYYKLTEDGMWKIYGNMSLYPLTHAGVVRKLWLIWEGIEDDNS